MTVNELISILKTLTGKEVLVYFLKFADKIINISNENENTTNTASSMTKKNKSERRRCCARTGYYRIAASKK